MEITTLLEIPKLEHDEEIGGYAYPEEFRNKLFIFKDQYIFIKSGSYDSFPKFILDNIISDYISKLDIKAPTYNEEYFSQLIQNQIALAFDNINSRFESLHEAAQDTVTLNQVYEVLENFKNNLKIPNSTCNNENTKEIISQELSIVYDNMTKIIQETVHEHLNKLPAVRTEIISSKPTISKLLLLKESGYSVQEIKELIDCGLI